MVCRCLAENYIGIRRRPRGSGDGMGSFQDADLQQAAGLAFLPTLAVLLAMLGHLAQILAAVLIHTRHLAHAHALHRAGFSWRLDSRHPRERKREAEQ